MIALVIVVLAIVVVGRGGYEPWAALALGIGAATGAIAIVFQSSAPGDARERLLEEHRAWQCLPWTSRHAWWSRLTGRRGAPRADVEISTAEGIVPTRHGMLLGTPFPRTGLAAPLFLLTLWIGLSAVPIDRGLLQFLSPEAHALRSEVEPYIGGAALRASLSLVPFLTLRGLWIWLAYVIFFYIGFRIASQRDGAHRLTICLVVLGTALAGTGLLSSFVGWRHFVGDTTTQLQLRAVAGFGNPNHFAAFLSMIFFCGIGIVPAGRAARRAAQKSMGRVRSHEDIAKTVLVCFALCLIALGIVFSLSRSVIALTLLTASLFAVLWKRAVHGVVRTAVGGMVLATLALTVWIGIEPVLDRFERLPERLESGMNRRQVAIDTVPAALDFWLTGSGLGSNRYITARYRSFPGRIFYSWVHNDYLQLLVELGVPGLVLLLWAMARWLALGRRVRQELASQPARANLHAGYLCAGAAVALHSFTDFGLHLPANFMLLAIVAGVVVGMRPGDAMDREGSPRLRRSRLQ